MQDDPLHVRQQQSAAPFANLIGRTRFVVLIAVGGILLVAMSLFALGAIQAVIGVYEAWTNTFDGNSNPSELTVQFLELVGLFLKAVAFYIIGVGLYSLFIAPLNVAVSLGVESLHDLESKVISVAVVIFAVTFLEHFVRWEHPLVVLQFGGAMAAAVFSLVFFQWVSHKIRAEQRNSSPNTTARSKAEMFKQDEEVHELKADEQ